MATAIPPHSIPPRSIAIAAAAEDQAWRGRTRLACSILGLGLIGVGAINLDWGDGAAVAFGQLAGMVAPVAGLALAVWSAATLVARRR